MPLRLKDVLENITPRKLAPLDPREQKAIKAFRNGSSIFSRWIEKRLLKSRMRFRPRDLHHSSP